jgi:hypothetical protein
VVAKDHRAILEEPPASGFTQGTNAMANEKMEWLDGRRLDGRRLGRRWLDSRR